MKTEDIEFKAKTCDGEWVYGCYAEYKAFGEEVRRVIIDRRGSSESIMPETLCEYSRKRDKNGAKIYENDLVRMYVVNTTYYKRPFEEEVCGEVCRGDDGAFHISANGGPKYSFNNTMVVVGSKFD